MESFLKDSVENDDFTKKKNQKKTIIVSHIMGIRYDTMVYFK